MLGAFLLILKKYTNSVLIFDIELQPTPQNPSELPASAGHLEVNRAPYQANVITKMFNACLLVNFRNMF
ncbi:hypothetical protein ABTK33_20975, partial [Acinetobacter baumannii]